MSERIGFITGVTGQDGAYLAELLLGKGYVVHGVKFVERAFAQVGRRIKWRGSGVDELEPGAGRPLVEIDPRYFRPTEVDFLCGDPSKARAKLGWSHKISFDVLVREMVDSDLKMVQRESVRRNRDD
jgi:GDPmannose 4,6-dehydratase